MEIAAVANTLTIIIASPFDRSYTTKFRTMSMVSPFYALDYPLFLTDRSVLND